MPNKKEETIIQTSKALGLDKLVPEIYKDLVQPTARELGKGLSVMAKTVNAALSPLEGLVWGYETIREHLIKEISEKLKNRSKENICTPPLNVAGPLVEALKYAGHSKILRDMYTNLLASSMDAETVASAHPCFVEIIKQLSPDEAKILVYFPQIKNYPLIIQKMDVTNIYFRYDHLTSLFREVCEKAKISHLELRNGYLDNLMRLKIVDCGYTKKQKIIRSPEDNQNNMEYILDERCDETLFVTAFGQFFIEACIDTD